MRVLWLFLALVGLLAAACGSDSDESASESGIDGLAGRAPPVVTGTATATAQAAASDLSDRLDAMTLDEDDVPRGLSPLRSMTFDYDASLLGVVGSEASKAHMTMFAGPGQQEMVMSVVILLDDARAVEQALAQVENLTVDQIQDTFGVPSNFGGPKLRDSRRLDVSDLGETAFGLALTFELPQIGVGDGQWVFFGRDSLLAMTMTVAMDGVAPADAVTLAEVMDGKIKDVILQ
jgi:alpha-D-ribose 1-methylphosphonate 5-triphosphate synthase subunit PhnI